MKRVLVLAAVLTAAASLPGLAAAQQRDHDRQTYRLRLDAGFAPDPAVVEVTAGGWRPAENLSDGCVGIIGGEPDVELDYRAGDWPLFIRTRADADTTLTVRTPRGDWLCDDDSAGDLNAEVMLAHPPSGRYAVWVGVFDGPPAPAALFISEMESNRFDHDGEDWHHDDWHGDEFAYEDNGERPLPHLDPSFGSRRLRHGFTPDPHTVSLVAGGTVNAAFVGHGCPGFVAAAPDYRLDYQAGDFSLIIRARSSADTTLLVSLPNGDWACDDDSAGNYNPELRFDRPMSGTYDIWVGVFGGDFADAELIITEID